MDSLPTDLKLHVLRLLSPVSLLAFLGSSGVTWSDADDALWRGLCAQHGIVVPSRMRSSLKNVLLAGLRAAQERRLQLLYELRSTIWGGDSAAKLRRAFDSDPLLNPSTPLPAHGHATLLQLAARRGRLNCVRELVGRDADLDAADNGNFTALAGAAWNGQKHIVHFLVERGARLDIEGSPPMTSVCGGRGPFTAEEWAWRKVSYYEKGNDVPSGRVSAFRDVARYLECVRLGGQPADGRSQCHSAAASL